MLKIKDNVDLKELEKFGYQVYHYNYVINKPYEKTLYVKGIKSKPHHIMITIENRVIKCEKTYQWWYYPYKRTPHKYIQDLIDAGLVEKVVEDD